MKMKASYLFVSLWMIPFMLQAQTIKYEYDRGGNRVSRSCEVAGWHQSPPKKRANTSSPTSVDHTTEKSKEPRVFPNPTKGRLNISIVAEVRYALYDSDGRFLLSGSLPAGLSQVNMGSLPHGVYVLKIDGTDGEHWQDRL